MIIIRVSLLLILLFLGLVYIDIYYCVFLSHAFMIITLRCFNYMVSISIAITSDPIHSMPIGGWSTIAGCPILFNEVLVELCEVLSLLLYLVHDSLAVVDLSHVLPKELS
jgi:hypothetical protein